MKVFLSSQHLGNDPQAFARLCGEVKVAVIMNAADIQDTYQEYTDSVIASLNNIGLEASEFDLRKYFGNKSALKKDLAPFGAVWVAGGNTFILLRAMYQSGFAAEVKKRVEDGTLVYGGFSAGAVVATLTLRGIEFFDQPDEVPKNYNPEIIWEGLGLYNQSIVPHYGPEDSSSQAAVTYFEKHDMPYRTLTDGETITLTT